MLSVKPRAKNPSGSHPENKSDVTVREKTFVITKLRTRDLSFNHILGCKPPAGSILSDCTSKGKKYTICTAKCANGNEGEWRTRCSKKKGKYIWDSIAAKVEAACN